MTAAEIQTLINAAKSSEADLVTWTELRAILEGLKNQEGAEGDYTLDMLGDVDIDGFLDDTQVLRWNGTAWVNEVLTTDDIAEGNNLFFTLSRSRNAISGGTGISYNPATGEIISTITQYTSAMARAAISLTTTGSGAATYNSSTGVLNIPTPSSVNLYNSDGTLTGNRTVTMGAFDLSLSANRNGFLNFGIYNADITNTSARAGLTFGESSSSRFMSLWKYGPNFAGYKFLAGGDAVVYNTSNGDIALLNDFATGRIKFGAGGASTAQMTLFSTGNIGINTTTDAGFRLDVNGTMRVQNTATFSNTSFTGSLTISTTANNTHRITATGLGNYIQFGPGNSVLFHGDLVMNTNYDIYLARNIYQTNDRQYIISGFTPNNDTRTGWNLYANYVNAGSGGTNTGHFANIIPDITNATSGTYTVNVLRVRPTINVTNGTNTVTGIVYDPVLTATTGLIHNAMRLVTGNVFMCVSSGYVGIGATADTAYKLSVDGDLRIYGNIRTAQPTGGTGVGVWRLGSTATGSFTLNTSQCLEVELNGTLYRIATLNLA